MPVAVRREAQFKRGLCLASLQRHDEAAGVFEQLLSETDDRWSPAAGCQLLLLRMAQKKPDEADVVLELLQSRYTPDKLSQLISTELRDSLIEQNIRDFHRVDRLLRHDPERLHALQRLIAIDRLLSPDGRGRASVAISLVQAYRFEDRLEEALRVCEEDAPAESPMVKGLLVYHHARILRQLGRAQEGINKIREWQRNNPQNSSYGDLPIETVRCQVALQQWEEAEASLDRLLSEDVSAARRSASSLLKGFLLERRGLPDEAQRVWLNGYQRIGHDIVILSPTFQEALMLGSLTDQPLLAEAERLIAGAGSFGPAAAVARAALNPTSVAAAIRQCWRRPQARAWLKKYAAGDVTMRERLHMPILFSTGEFIARNAFGEVFDSDETDIAQKVADELMRGFLFEGSLNSSQLVQSGLAWKGNFGFLGWSALGPTLPEGLRAHFAYVLAHRAIRQNQPAAAVSLLKQAAQPAKDRELLIRLAERDSKLLESKQGLLRVQSTLAQPIELVLESEDQSTQTITVDHLHELDLPVGKYSLRSTADPPPQIEPSEFQIAPITRTEVRVR